MPAWPSSPERCCPRCSSTPRWPPSAYAKYDLSNELGRLNQDQQDLTAQLDAKASPTQLAAAAAALGMVPTNGTGWLRLSDGSVQGVPEPAGAGG